MHCVGLEFRDGGRALLSALVIDVRYYFAGNGEADSFVAARLRKNERVDADDIFAGIYQRPATIARVAFLSLHELQAMRATTTPDYARTPVFQPLLALDVPRQTQKSFQTIAPDHNQRYPQPSRPHKRPGCAEREKSPFRMNMLHTTLRANPFLSQRSTNVRIPHPNAVLACRFTRHIAKNTIPYLQ
jgi:hypothetical protein